MTAPDRETPPEFTAYAMGLCFASVCTTLTDVEATARLNAEHPGVVWRVSPAETFKRGDPNGGACEEFPGSHRHLLFERQP